MSKTSRKSKFVAAKRQPRANEAQIDVMVDYMVQHPHVSTGIFQGLHGSRDLQGSWEDLAATLNSMFGDGRAKDVESWKTTWRDNKTKVSNKVSAYKKAHSATGNIPVDITLTGRDKKMIGLLGFEYIEGLDSVPDAFPEEISDVNELVVEGNDDAIVGAVPQAFTIQPFVVTVPSSEDITDSETLESSTSCFYVPDAENSSPGTSTFNDLQVAASHTANVNGASTSAQNKVTNEVSYNIDAGPSKAPSQKGNPLNTPARKETVKRTTGQLTSRSKFLRRGVHHERIGIQLEDARGEFSDLARRTCEATELMAQAEMRRAEAAVLMAENDRSRTEIMKTLAENDKARNEVLLRLVGTLDLIHQKLTS